MHISINKANLTNDIFFVRYYVNISNVNGPSKTVGTNEVRVQAYTMEGLNCLVVSLC